MDLVPSRPSSWAIISRRRRWSWSVSTPTWHTAFSLASFRLVSKLKFVIKLSYLSLSTAAWWEHFPSTPSSPASSAVSPVSVSFFQLKLRTCFNNNHLKSPWRQSAPSNQPGEQVTIRVERAARLCRFPLRSFCPALGGDEFHWLITGPTIADLVTL